MIRNVGSIDQVIRLVIGFRVLSLVFVGPKTNWGYLGLIPLLTAATGICPLYRIFGISTCRRAERKA